MNRKVLLMILDGWGEGKHDHSNAIYTQGAPFIDSLRAKYPMSHLQACGEYVGLPDGQMGNSEVGHMNLGAGRVVYQDLVKINMACRDHKLLDNKEIRAAYDYVKTSGGKLHFMGLCSHGGVHSSLDHLYEFLAVAKQEGLDKVYVHCFMDGRDTDPHSGMGFIKELEEKMAATTGRIATVCGRFYAMDRDKRWARVKEAYDMLVEGKGAQFGSAVEAMQASYDADVTDEFVKPAVICENGAPVAKVEANDAVIFFNFRNDRARELTSVLTQKDMPEEGMHTLPLLPHPLRRILHRGAHPLRQGGGDRHPRGDRRQGREAPAPHSRDREICACDLLLQRRPRDPVRERGPHTRELPEGRHLRPPARDERD